jgi:gentisate 1,2-dioxygenase
MFNRPSPHVHKNTHHVTTHYHIQKKRRAEFIEEWRTQYRQTVIREEDVAPRPDCSGLAARRLHWDGDGDPIPRGASTRWSMRSTRARSTTDSTVTRGDAILFMVDGSGWTRSRRRSLRLEGHGMPIHLPPGAGTGMATTGTRDGRFMSYSSEPTLWTLW